MGLGPQSLDGEEINDDDLDLKAKGEGSRLPPGVEEINDDDLDLRGDGGDTPKRTARETLEAVSPGTPVLFISDPTNGDQFIIDPTNPEIPETAEGHEYTDAGDLLSRLDFGTYDEEQINDRSDLGGPAQNEPEDQQDFDPAKGWQPGAKSTFDQF